MYLSRLLQCLSIDTLSIDTRTRRNFFLFSFPGEVSGENVSAGSGPRSGDRGEGTDLSTHTENNDGATLAANTAVDARGGSPQGAHLSGAATPRPLRGRRRQNQNGLDTTQVSSTTILINFYPSYSFFSNLQLLYSKKSLLQFLEV